MPLTIDVINQVCTDLGGTTTHSLTINALNEICTLLGGTGGHDLQIDALNEICEIQGKAHAHKLNIDALNAIGETTYKLSYDAWDNIRKGTTLNYPDNAVVTTTNGNYIVSVDGKFILTVEGFFPLNAMRTLNGSPVVTQNNEYITI